PHFEGCCNEPLNPSLKFLPFSPAKYPLTWAQTPSGRARVSGATPASTSCGSVATRARTPCGPSRSFHRVVLGALRTCVVPSLLVAMDFRIEHRSYPSLFRTEEAGERGIGQYRLRFDPRFRTATGGIHAGAARRIQHPAPTWVDAAWMEES